MSNYPTPAAVRTTPGATLRLPSLIDLFRGRSGTRLVDMVWTPGVCAALIIVVGAIGFWLHQPWLFAGLGPTILVVASNPDHDTARFLSLVDDPRDLRAALAIVAFLPSTLWLTYGTELELSVKDGKLLPGDPDRPTYIDLSLRREDER